MPPSFPHQNKNTSISCIINENAFLSHLFWLIKGRKCVCVRPELQTSDFNYWPGKGGSSAHTHKHTQTVVSDIRTGFYSTQPPMWGSVRSQLDNRWAWKWQPTNLYNARLTHCLSARVPDFAFGVWHCVCVERTEREELPVWGDTFLQHNWEGIRHRQR